MMPLGQESYLQRARFDWARRWNGRGILQPLYKFEGPNSWAWQAFCLPGSELGTAGIPARETYEGQVKVPPFSFVTGISGQSNRPEGFRVQLKEAKTGRLLFNDFLPSLLLGNPANPNYQQLVFPSPYAAPDDGMLAMQISNLAPVAADCQVMITIAVPELQDIKTAEGML